jgi:hypothetical protein
MSLQVALHARQLSEKLLDVRALRSSSNHNCFWWMVRDFYGQLIETSSTTYDTEAEARRAADSVARIIRSIASLPFRSSDLCEARHSFSSMRSTLPMCAVPDAGTEFEFWHLYPATTFAHEGSI